MAFLFLFLQKTPDKKMRRSVGIAVAVTVGAALYYQYANPAHVPAQVVPGDRKVLITGAGGQTGSMVFRKLLASSKYDPIGTVRSTKSRDELCASLKIPTKHVAVIDIASSSGPDQMVQALSGVEAVVILTSAVPKIIYSSLPSVIWGRIKGEKAIPDFYYAPGGEPQQVDWLGQKVTIDACKRAGVKHVVLVSSMGGTKPDHFLNKIGGGKILLWKRKAEEYLMASGLSYTIIHPGGLLGGKVPKPGKRGGERELVVAVDDALMDEKKKSESSVPREDVAEICMLALDEPAARNRSFDLGSKPPEKSEERVFNGDLAALLTTLQGRNCDYSKPAGGVHSYL
eukprot:g38098.t1